MATYQELFDLSTERAILERVAIACVVKAEVYINDETPIAGEITWANNTLADPITRARTIINYVLAANRESTTEVIRAASDSIFQANVNSAVNAMVLGGVT